MIRSILFTTLFSLIVIASSQNAIATPLGGALVFDLVAVEGTQDFSITASGSSDTSTNAAAFEQLNLHIINGSNGHFFVNGTPASLFAPSAVPDFQTLSAYVSGEITLSLDTGPSYTSNSANPLGLSVRGFFSTPDFAMGLPVFDEQGTTTTASGVMQLELDPSMGTTDAFFKTGTYTQPGVNGLDYVLNISTVAVPEPTSLALLSLGAVGMVLRRRRTDS